MSDVNSTEEWRDIVGFEGRYQVSSLGRVQSMSRVLTPSPNADGYRLVNLQDNKTRYVSHLVAQAFLGPRPKNAVVAHKNDDRTDDSVTNLAYKTHKQNMEDKAKNGRQMRGSKLVTLHERDIPVIRSKLAQGMSKSAIARLYGVTPATIRSIAHGRTWTQA